MNTTAIIVTHNNANTITACIDSLKKHHVPHIIVVDNASQDATVTVVQKSGVKIIRNSQNKGFATAVNQAASTIDSQRSNVLLLNPDAELRTSIKPAPEYLQENPRVGIIGFGLRDKNNQPERHNHGQSITPLSIITRRVVGSKVKGHMSKVPATVGWVSGAAMLIRQETYTQLGGFDPDFFLYWEDVDFCRRAADAGWQTVYLPQIVVTHQRGASLADLTHKTTLYDSSADRYFRKHYPTPIWLLPHLSRRIYRIFSRQVS